MPRLVFRNHVAQGERGGALVEYGLLVALFAVVALAVIGATGFEIQAFFDNSPLDITDYLP